MGAEPCRRAANEAVVRRIFDAFARQQGFALRDLFARDAVWTVPGRGVMAGVYRGRDEIFRFLGRLPKETDGTYGSRLIDVLASWGTRGGSLSCNRGAQGAELDIDQVLLFRLEDGARRRSARVAIRSRGLRRVLGAVSAISRVPWNAR